MFVVGPAEFLSVFMLTGLAGVPLSVPPLPEDPALARVAPQECLWYMSAAGTAQPDAGSSNRTEQLLAEPQVQALLSGIEAEIVRFAHLQATDEEERILAAELPGLIRIGLTHPLAAYVADFEPGIQGPRISAGLVVKLDERTEEVERSIQILLTLVTGQPATAEDEAEGRWHDLRLPPEAPPVRWGMQNGWFILGVGEGEAERVAQRLTAESAPPGWLQRAKSELPMERRSTLAYLNVPGILFRVQPTLGREAARVPEALGLNNVQAIYTSTGMDDVACVGKGLIALDGPPRGVFALLPQLPLSEGDLAVVPRDATASVALRLEPRQTLDRLIDLVSRFEPRARQDFEETLWKADAELGIDIRNDLLGTLGDTLVVHMPGGDLFTSWTGTSATVTISDRRRLERALDKLSVVGRLELERNEGIRFRESEFGDYTLHYLQFVSQPVPITPSWCVTEDHLVIGLTPQSVKSAIARLEQQGASVADVDAVADALAGDAPPAVLAYVDTERLFRGLYPLMTWGLQAMVGEMAREGFQLDLALLPSVEVIAPHLVPSVATWRLTPEGYRYEAKQSLPGGDLVSTAPFVVALALPAVNSSRAAARRAQEMNQLRQLGLAMHNYHDVHGHFPTNIYDENGKALLSWRVQLLPYVGQQPLYEQFHLDEPWDSPHNKPLVEHMPQHVFRSPSSPAGAPGRTRFLALVHEKSLFPGNEELKVSDVLDGTSNTILFVQAAPQAAVEWTRPDDIQFDPENPKQGLLQPGGPFLAIFADGHTQGLSFDLSEETLRRLVFRNDGQPIDAGDLSR